MASRQVLIPRIAAIVTSFSPLPCQAWHGYGASSAHRVEVEVVGADGHANTPPSGAAAAAPPAGSGIGEHMARGQESQPDTVCILVIFSSQPPTEEGRLG
jgi:hypothetical protein